MHTELNKTNRIICRMVYVTDLKQVISLYERFAQRSVNKKSDTTLKPNMRDHFELPYFVALCDGQVIACSFLASDADGKIESAVIADHNYCTDHLIARLQKTTDDSSQRSGYFTDPSKLAIAKAQLISWIDSSGINI